MALVQNFNVNPYYDDYDEDKKFLRMLFRPGYAVQARELTQLQTILQKQVSRFGKHVFKNGSVVTGGEISISSTVLYHKLKTTTTAGADVDVNDFLGKTIGNAHALLTNAGLGKVVGVIEATETDPPTIIVEYKTALSLVDGEVFYTVDADLIEGRLIDSASTDRASTASINEGVYFIDDFFVKVSAQTIVLEKYSNLPSYRIGLTYEESIVDETSDTSLLDPALNASNYQAPGSTRYKVTLTLDKRSLASTDDTKFIELIRIENGTITLRNSYPLYADLERTLARRTYDESGNYTVKPFTIYLKDHVPDVGNTSNSSLFTAKLSAGKAYVRGFEIETVSPINLTLSRARDISSVSNYDIAANYGNYITVANTSGLLDVGSMGIIDMHCVDNGNVLTTNTATYNSTKIGTVRVRELEYVSAANTQLPNTYKYNLYLYDTRFTGLTANSGGSGTSNTIILASSGASSGIDDAYTNTTIRISSGYGADNLKHRIVSYNGSTQTATIADTFSTQPRANSIYTVDFNIKDIESFAAINSSTTIIASANVDLTNKVGQTSSGNTFFSDTDFKSLVFRVPQSFVSFGMSDQDFRGKVVFKNQTVSAGTLSISTGSANNVFVGSGVLSDSQVLQHFYVTANAATGVSEFTNGEVVPFVSGLGRDITVSTSSATLDFNSSNTFTVDVIATVDFNTTSPKTKTLVSANTTHVGTGGTSIGNTTVYLAQGQVAISTPNKIPGQSDSLYISDVYKLEGQFEETYGYFDVLSGTQTIKSSFKVIDSGNTSAAVTTSDLTNSAKDITTRYILNDGQQDGYYDHGSITLKSGATPPIGQILILVNYFTHAGSGYFTVDSYNNSSLGATEDIRYAKIPNYTSPTTGQVYKLRDCVDFRPIRTNSSNTSPNFTLTGISIPRADEALESDYSYYLPRTDRIVLGEDKKFKVIKGISSLYPQTPIEPENSMSLYTIRVNPYTFFPTDTRIRFIENKRYTMRDIGKLEKRIENLEYYTSLNTLEKSAQDLTILDVNGLERFKNGILVDSFRGHQVGDVKNIDYRCSMNFEQGELRPSFYSNSISFLANTSLTTANVEAGTIIVSPYTIKEVITQNVATTGIAVNPFTLSNYSGTLDLFPSGDFWIDTETRPDVLINIEGENDAWEEIGKALEDVRAPGWGNQWQDWNEYVSGKNTDVTSFVENRTEGYLDYQDTVQNTTNTTYYSRERFGSRNVLVPERITKSIGNRQVDLSVIPYIRAQWIIAVAKRLRPNQYHYLFAEQGDLEATKYVEYPTIAWLYNVSGDFNDSYGIYETVTSSSGGSARLLKQSGRSWSLNQPVIYLGDVRGTFAANDTVTGTVSGATGKIDIMFWNNGNVSTAAASTITLNSGAPYDNAYVNVVSTYASVSWPFTGTKLLEDPKEKTEFYNIRITAGKGLGQQRTITNYNGTTKVATITPNWDVVPDSTSRWSVGKIQSDDHGDMAGRWYIPNYGPTSYDNGWRSRTGARLIRLTNDANNNPLLTNSFAEEYWHAQGVLNTVEEVSVSVRVPTIQNQSIYELQDNYRQTSVVEREILGTTLVADRTPPPSGGGSGCKIICTKLHELGYLPDDIFEADQLFGEWLRENDPYAYYGYIKWASVVVDWMEKDGPQCMFWIRDKEKRNQKQKEMAIRWAKKIATPWAQHMAYKMGVIDNDSRAGRAIMKTGIFVSRLIGKLTKADKPTKSVAIGYAMWVSFALFWLLANLKDRKTQGN